MLVYGSKGKLVASETLLDKCSSCGTNGSVQMNVFQRYIHIFWIPFFPINKTGVSQCNHCQQVLSYGQMPPALKNDYHNLKATARIPRYMFSGLGLLAILIIAIMYGANQNDKENVQYINAPAKGDIYEVKTAAGQYTLYRVDELRGDTVFVQLNDFEVNKLSGLRKIKDKGLTAYSKETVGFLKTELKDMLAKDRIIDVDRD